jgi:hypothetical protein
MKRVFKYPIQIADTILMAIPQNAEILSVQLVSNETVVYVLIDPDEPVAARKIYCCGTGHDIKQDNLRYISTVVYRNGVLVFHFFEDQR